MRDLIDRQAAIDARRYTFGNDEFSLEAAYHDCKMVFDGITDDDSFQEADTGLILYYANEIIYALQEALVKDTNVPTNDCISRQAAIDEITEYGSGNTIYMSIAEVKRRIEHLPSAQPERTCVNCGRTANNGGWYADGRTRCPIEEHYALPKDGFCHLWEKRNVTDDDYQERREE